MVVVYPNPNTGVFKIDVESEKWRYQLLDLNGKVILSSAQLSYATQVNISGIAKGVYILKINIGDSQIFKRVVKQ